MTVALSTRVLGAEPTAERVLAEAERLDVRAFVFHAPPARPRRLHERLRASAVAVLGVHAPADVVPGEAGFAGRVHETTRAAAATRARAVVVEGGRFGPDGDREALAERTAPALHALLAAGVPVVLRNGAAERALADLEVVGWLLSDLPRLGLWLDPVRVEAGARAGGASLAAWTDAFADRVAGVVVHGPGPDGLGGGHPDDGGPPWDRLAEVLPLGAVWTLDLDPVLGGVGVGDALAFLRGVLGRRT